LPFEEAETLRSWGSALAGTGNRAEADEKFDAAMEIYRRCGAGQRWIDRVEATRNHQPAPTSPVVSESSSIFRREGDFWIIVYQGETRRVRNLKGLSYIAYLLSRPGERIHSIDLVRAIEGGPDATGDSATALADGLSVERGIGDAGDLIDARAAEEYRSR